MFDLYPAKWSMEANMNHSKLTMKEFLKDEYSVELDGVQAVAHKAYEFDAKAAEVAIFDYRGQLVWKTKNATQGKVRWNGFDIHGQLALTGDYLCKVLYPNGQARYIPFVHA
jgi:hypothetical protein